jgi:hypothetical protein
MAAVATQAAHTPCQRRPRQQALRRILEQPHLHDPEVAAALAGIMRDFDNISKYRSNGATWLCSRACWR